MSPQPEPADLLCVAPHTDDAEIGFGGSLRLLAERGRRIWVCDLTEGELGSNATPGERWAEAIQATAVLGLTGRVQLRLPDGFIDPDDPQQVAALTAVLRWLRPRWVVCAPEARRHPDHLATPQLLRKAAFMAHLQSYVPELPQVGRGWPDPVTPWVLAERWRCEALFEICPVGGQPSLIFDCSETWTAKQEALACFRSQFSREPGRAPTMINDAQFLAKIDRRGAAWGFRAGVRFGEALSTLSAPVLGDLPAEIWA